jgi:hypothetical protein
VEIAASERDVVVDAEPAGREPHRRRHQQQREQDEQHLMHAGGHQARII